MKISIFEFILASLATYRISLMVVREKGPGHVFKKTREVPSKHSKVYDWLTCLFCFSMTASALCCGALWLAGFREHWGMWFLVWNSLSAIAIVIHMKFNNQEP